MLHLVERHERLAGDCFGQQRLAGARLALQEDALRRLRAQLAIPDRVLQELRNAVRKTETRGSLPRINLSHQ